MNQACKPVILVFTGYYLPGYKAGGPIRTIENMVAGLKEDFTFRIFTRDRDVGDSRPYPGIRVNEWNPCGSAQVFYADPGGASYGGIRRVIADVCPEVVYLNSFFDPDFTVAPLVLRRLGLAGGAASWVVAPRGEFSRGALAINARKKRAFIGLAQMTRLYRDVVWQASSIHEQEDIEREFAPRDAVIHVAPDMTPPLGQLPPKQQTAAAGKALRACFVSRISLKKNLLFAIEALQGVRAAVDFNIYGPVEDEGYAAACRNAIKTLPAHVRVAWHGEVPHDHVRDVFAGQDLFVFPTAGENFGHVVFESLAAGTPVLVSDQTPWRDLDARGVGWVRPLEGRQAFVDVIEKVAAMEASERAAIAGRAQRYATEVSRSSSVLESNRALFRNALNRGIPKR